ncbi:BMC domain-containing protein, partial [Escherichia coli]|uniref:BMC domain-containing protein n=1 Tax=Escherichia coli TaxID=562 RepID=UPI002575F2B7
YENIGSGLGTVMVKGDVGAVNAAVDSGVEAARRIGEVVTSRVIARPHNDIEKIASQHKA